MAVSAKKAVKKEQVMISELAIDEDALFVDEAEFSERVLCLNFFDESSLRPVQLKAGEFELRSSGLKVFVSKKVSLELAEGSRPYVSLAEFLVEVHRKNSRSQTVLAELVSISPIESCGIRYACAPLMFEIPRGLDAAGDDCCGCLPMPLNKLNDTAIMRFQALDGSRDDYIEHALAFESEVQWAVTAIQSPTPVQPPGKTDYPAELAQAPQWPFRPFASVVRSVGGTAEVYGVPLHQLYQIEVLAQQGYIARGNATFQRYVCCERLVNVTSYLYPCGTNPTRSVVFVRQECPGKRWGGGQSVNIGGIDVDIQKKGILEVPEYLGIGVFPLSAPGVTFSPPVLDLTQGATPVTTIMVTEQPVKQVSVSHVFVDDNDQPFRYRTLTVELPNGTTYQVMTDDMGRFDAPMNSKVYAEDDAFGLATVPILVAETGMD
jgi:hypothetical protein